MHMMIDLETLALDPKAIVFQIGVAVFDIKSSDDPTAIRLNVDILPQIMRGRMFDRETQEWWMKQSKQSWSRWPADVETVTDALDYVNKMFTDFKVSHVWANSPSFDCVILRSLAKDFATELKWDFRSEMDVRTLKTMNSLSGLPPTDPFETTHDAAKDCLDQIHKVRYYWNNFVKR